MIITLCGSTKFKPWFEAVEANLSLQGHVVLNVSSYSHYYNLKLTPEEEEILCNIHLKKIDLSNAIYVINKNGYIGDSTANEIEYAKNLNKKIFYLE